MPVTSGVYFALGTADTLLTVSPTWTAAETTDQQVSSIDVRRGRKDEFERTGTGEATVTIDVTGTVDPDAFIGRPVRVDLLNPDSGTAFPIFRGHVNDARYQIEPSENVARLELGCADALDYLAGYEFSPDTAGHPGDRPAESDGNIFYSDADVNDRILSVLGDADWPLGLSEIFSGNVQVWETVYPPRTTALEALGDAADAEWPGVANVYVSSGGTVTFHGRRARFFPDVAEYNIDEWWLGDGQAITSGTADNYAQIRELGYSRSRDEVINAALATHQDIDDADIEGQVVTDSASITEYGLHSWSAENLLTSAHKTDGTATPATALVETKKFATYYVDNYKAPATRISNVTVRSLPPDDPRAAYTWRVLTEIEISDIVHVETTHPGIDGGITESFFVEGISYEIRPLNAEFDDVTMTLDVSPQARYTSNPFTGDTL